MLRRLSAILALCSLALLLPSAHAQDNIVQLGNTLLRIESIRTISIEGGSPVPGNAYILIMGAWDGVNGQCSFGQFDDDGLHLDVDDNRFVSISSAMSSIGFDLNTDYPGSSIPCGDAGFDPIFLLFSNPEPAPEILRLRYQGQPVVEIALETARRGALPLRDSAPIVETYPFTLGPVTEQTEAVAGNNVYHFAALTVQIDEAFIIPNANPLRTEFHIRGVLTNLQGTEICLEASQLGLIGTETRAIYQPQSTLMGDTASRYGVASEERLCVDLLARKAFALPFYLPAELGTFTLSYNGEVVTAWDIQDGVDGAANLTDIGEGLGAFTFESVQGIEDNVLVISTFSEALENCQGNAPISTERIVSRSHQRQISIESVSETSSSIPFIEAIYSHLSLTSDTFTDNTQDAVTIEQAFTLTANPGYHVEYDFQVQVERYSGSATAITNNGSATTIDFLFDNNARIVQVASRDIACD